MPDFRKSCLGRRLASPVIVNLCNLDGHHLVAHIAAEFGGALAVGVLDARNGAVVASAANDEDWRHRLDEAARGRGFVFAGTRIAAVAALINKISTRTGVSQTGFKQIILASAAAVITFQKCPWQEDLVLFTVLRESNQLEIALVRLRVLLEDLARDIAVVCAPRRAEVRYVN